MIRYLLLLIVAAQLPACGGGITMVRLHGDPNPSSKYLCHPAKSQDGNAAEGEPKFDCKSGSAFYSYDDAADLSQVAASSHCKNGFVQLWIETDGHGDITRIQYQCAADPVTEWPQEDGEAKEGE